MTKIYSFLICYVFCGILFLSATKSQELNDDDTCANPLTNSTIVSFKHIFPGCQLYLAKSTIPNAGLGLFSSVSITGGHSVSEPDIIIQLIDALNMGSILSDYAWNPEHFGGQFEGETVHSILPGVGSLANAVSDFREANTIFFGIRDVDEADVPRTHAPGAGAFTHYHNVSFYALKDISPGDEILITYNNDPWFTERVLKFQSDFVQGTRRSLDWLSDHGICVDNIHPDRSKIKGVGRGAFASRTIPKGSIVAPAPIVVIDREFIWTNTTTGNKLKSPKPQLLLNYCFGHKNSSLLFYPVSPVVNLINHGRDTANARLKWSQSDQHDGVTWPWQLSLNDVKSLNTSGFMMDIVASRDILPNEEILIDYGQAWEDAWNKHVQDWKAPINAKMYSPSYVMDDVAALIRTEKEQQDHPYPSNIFTACFYRYASRKSNEGIAKSTELKSNEATAFQWTADKRTFEYGNLRPCTILSRDGNTDRNEKKVSYTVIMKNRRGLKPEEVIPKGSIHIVNGVPRAAIRFMDKPYTTDQHLENAFRHEIQIPDEYFPERWKDLM